MYAFSRAEEAEAIPSAVDETEYVSRPTSNTELVETHAESEMLNAAATQNVFTDINLPLDDRYEY